MTKITKKQSALIKSLYFTSRKPYSQLGRDSGFSKQGAEYALRRLEDKGIILGFQAIIDLSRLGYMYGRIFISLKEIDEKSFQPLINKLRSVKDFHWIFSTQGKYDILLAVWVKTLDEYSKRVQNITEILGNHVLDIFETIGTTVTYCNARYIYEGEYTQLQTQHPENTLHIDSTDIQILKILVQNARIPIYKIANKLDISSQVISYRIKQLESKKIILGYNPIINHFSLGFSYTKLLIKLNPGFMNELPKVYEYLKLQKELLYIVQKIGGDAELDIEIMVKDGQELYEFMRKVRFAFPKLILTYESLLYIDTIKAEFFPSDLL